jgi:hypothetical protein
MTGNGAFCRENYQLIAQAPIFIGITSYILLKAIIFKKHTKFIFHWAINDSAE